MGLVWQAGEPLWSTDTLNDPACRSRTVAQERDTGAFVFPVASEGKTIGVIASQPGGAASPTSACCARAGDRQPDRAVPRRQEQQRHIARLNRIYAVLSGSTRPSCAFAIASSCSAKPAASPFGRGIPAGLDRCRGRKSQQRETGAWKAQGGLHRADALGLDESRPEQFGLAGRAVRSAG